MIVTPEEEVVVRRIARIVRATRKQLGLSQEIVASRLGLIQSALSRIETGSQMLSAAQWAEFCAFTGISPDSIVSGYVDLKKPAVLKMDDREGTFRVARAYSKYRGSKIRALVPFLKYFQENFGDEELRKYLRSKKTDPDFFICLDNQISIDFLLDMACDLAQKGLLKAKDLNKIVKPIVRPDERMHGVLHYQYESKHEATDLLKALLENSKYYECNFSYAVENHSRKHFDFSVTPEEHMDETKYRSTALGEDFLCRYKKSYFERFTTYGGAKAAPLTELECHYKGHDRCVYRLELAS